MAHTQKPDFVFRRNGRLHLNWQGCLFNWLLANEVCASAVVMLDTPCSEVVWRVLATHSIFPFTSPLVCHSVPSHFSWTLSSAGGFTRAPFQIFKLSLGSPTNHYHLERVFCDCMLLWIEYIAHLTCVNNKLINTTKGFLEGWNYHG
jgi:hypothetical protein